MILMFRVLKWMTDKCIRLLGLFIWAIDQDDTAHSALQATLGGNLGVFADQNGYDPTNGAGDWDSVTGNSCVWSSTESKIAR
jgi:chitinase